MDEEGMEPPIPRPLVWLGNTKRRIRAFPREVQKLIGDELQLIQFGGMPRDAKPFEGVGPGVFEIALRHDTGAYRAVLAVRLGERVYVPHAFQKKSKTGIATPKQDVDLIKRRYAEAKRWATHEEWRSHEYFDGRRFRQRLRGPGT